MIELLFAIHVSGRLLFSFGTPFVVQSFESLSQNDGANKLGTPSGK